MLQNDRFSFLYAFFVFISLIVVRLYWFEYALGVEDYSFNDTVMITSHDGYYYAEGARDMLAGFHQVGDLSPLYSPLSSVSAIIVWLSDWKLDQVILFMPAIFGSLIAFPLYFIFIHFTQRCLILHAYAALCAFLGGIAISYYNRTMIGYYDTDMLLLVLPLSFYYYFFYLLDSKEQSYNLYHTLGAFVFGILACWWHNGLQNLFLALWFLHIVWLGVGKSNMPFMFEKLLHTTAIVSILTIPSHVPLQVILAITYLLLITYIQKQRTQTLFIAICIFMGFSVMMGCFDGAYYQFRAYFLQDIPENSALIFYDVVQTIREVGGVDYIELGERISSHFVLFILSFFGYGLLCYNRPIFLFSLPFVLLGLAGYKIGLRFNMLAAPFFAIALVFLLWIWLQYLSSRVLQICLFVLAAFLFCIPGVKHILDYKMPTVFSRQEAQTLSYLKILAKPDDYLVTWWDYGYGARYYGDIKTLIDGGKHSGAANYPVSYMLITPNMAASALLARITTEITQKHIQDSDQNSVMERILAAYGAYFPQSWLLGLENGVWDPPAKTHDIFYYIPFKIFKIFNTIDQFSNIDLTTGETLRDHIFYFSDSIQAQEEKIYINHSGRYLILDRQNGFLQISQDKALKLKELIVVSEEPNGDPFISTLPLSYTYSFYADSSLRAIYFKTQNAVILTDEYHYYATVLQLFMGYHHDIFEWVASNPMARIFKVSKE